ncbi:MAG: sugar kinase [Myxococcales bacterium]|nr:sugar kinase [Myxococcales bacterium]
MSARRWRAAVVGHVEWVSFFDIDVALHPGAIARAGPGWSEAAGGGGMAAVELARLAGSCTLFTALGDDAVGRGIAAALQAHGVDVRAEWRPEPHRCGHTYVDPQGERTIVVIGPAQEPAAAAVDVADADVVYLCKGNADVVRAARAARVVCATARILPALQVAGVRLDVLVHSAEDPSERYTPGDLDPAPRLVATTEGAKGGRYRTDGGRRGRWEAAPLPGPVIDTYGAGDCFAAGLGFALARGDGVEEALQFAAGRGAAALSRRGAHGAR